MFKYISEILSQFTRQQRIIALLMVLLTITLISLAPSLISAITTDRSELEYRISKQDEKIYLLENTIDTLDQKIRSNQRSCTQELFAREEEFIKMLDDIKAEAYKCRTTNNTTNRLSRMEKAGRDTIMRIEKIQIPETKTDISPILMKIEKMKNRIRKN
jgi:predicted RNase H-like nuclease (RuvC/YqgF family)